jgi:hypothetical protein
VGGSSGEEDSGCGAEGKGGGGVNITGQETPALSFWRLSGGAGARGRHILEPFDDLRQSPLGDVSRAIKRPAGVALAGLPQVHCSAARDARRMFFYRRWRARPLRHTHASRLVVLAVIAEINGQRPLQMPGIENQEMV